MNKKLIPIIGIAALVLAMVGCRTGGDTFTAFKDTWTIAHTAYQIHCERVVQGKVSIEEEMRVDAAWNNFRGLFRAALLTAQRNWEAATPDPVQEAAITFVSSIPQK